MMPTAALLSSTIRMLADCKGGNLPFVGRGESAWQVRRRGGVHCYRCAPQRREASRARHRHGSDLIVVAGGDGTINEVTQGMAGTDVPLAILPAGTANVLACEMGVSGDIGKAAKQLSLIRLNGFPQGRSSPATTLPDPSC